MSIDTENEENKDVVDNLRSIYPKYILFIDLINKANESPNNNPLTTEEVLNLVKNCPKQRFGIKTVESDLFIRANQGQSKNVGALINSDELLVKFRKQLIN